MMTFPIHIGQTSSQDTVEEIAGSFVLLDGKEYYRISNYDRMQPFFISLVSDSDHWLYISSKGGLTAGRKNPENALFPYYTDDKIHDSGEITGSKTILLVNRSGKTFLWEPFSDRYEGIYQIERNLYKNIYGNQLIFEEVNQDLKLTFSYRWCFSQQYGFVKKSRLTNESNKLVQVRLLDGLQNLLPYGVELKMQTDSSTLLDAYKKNELLSESGLGLFLLSSIPVDKAEPSEALKATTVWSVGLEVGTHLLSSRQLGHFRKGALLVAEKDIRAERGAYFIESTFELNADEKKTWCFLAEINQGPVEVAALNAWIRKGNGLISALNEDIDSGTGRLVEIVANADGLQKSADKMLSTRHFANVLFNVMRGGIFDRHYEVQKKDLLAFIRHTNQKVEGRHNGFFKSLPAIIHYPDLLNEAAKIGNGDLQRLCFEYLPLTFSRRHGDPSRPWNHFSIDLLDEAGEKQFSYQGNWRDIFQNWEALAISYPLFIESMISKFVNASTVDGYNPYRITRDGIDWEVIDEEDPWSYIGYWGDHQIIYLLKLLELSRTHHPGKLDNMLSQRIFAYANVPYRIKNYPDLLADPQDTIAFDHKMEAEVSRRVQALGADGKLVWDRNGDIYLVNLTEKLLVTLLAKLSNFIPEAGIWMNTQRPEWNDANNALVGYGVSMVTLCYIRRFVTFCQTLFGKLENEAIEVSEEVATLFKSITDTFERYQTYLDKPLTGHLRRQILDDLSKAGETYRNQVYPGFSEKRTPVSLKELDEFFTRTLRFIDHSIRANQRPDKLYHSYNLMKVEEDGGIAIRYLYEMLEGQVAVLSAGLLSPSEALSVCQALRKSSLYRADQHSYILYPDRQLSRFEAKNNIPEEALKESDLLMVMIANGDRQLIEKDIDGRFHFNANFHNQKDVADVLEKISMEGYGDLPEIEQEKILNIFEAIFDHQSFTGRSGTFFGYEGLGSIYWHMVSKLLLAVEENCLWTLNGNADKNVLRPLIEYYFDVRKGIGFNKDPKNYGAFPSDPYSHTPGNAGAQQPGMTGQVKEDILARFGELGVLVKAGKITFKPNLLRQSEFLHRKSIFSYIDLSGSHQELGLPKNSMAFTYCQVPIIYQLADQQKMIIHLSEGSSIELPNLEMDLDLSDQLFRRTGKINQVEVFLNPTQLYTK